MGLSLANRAIAQPPESAPAIDAGRTVKRGGAIAVAGQGVKLVLQLGATAFLARLLSPSDFGLIALVTPIVAFFSVFRDIGLTSATIYSADITDAEASSLFWINAIAGALLSISLLLLSPLAALIFHDSRLTGILSAMALTFILNGVGAQYQALFQRRFRFKVLALIDVGANAAGTAVGIFAALLGYGYWSLVLMPIATQALNLAATVLVSRWQPGAPRWERRTGTMTRFGSAIAAFNFLNYFARNLDNLLIGKVWGMEALGYYGRAYSLMMAPLSQIIYPLTQVVVPVLTRINGNRDAYVRTYTNIMQVIMLICAPLVTWLIVGRIWVVEILLGPRWHETIPIFLALGFSALVQPMNNSAGWLMVSQGRSKDVFIWGLIGGGLTSASILIGLPWGALPVAISYSVGQIVFVTPILWWFCCRKGFVHVIDLISVSLPLLTVCTMAGLLFEAFRVWVLPLHGGSVPAPIGLVMAFVWVVGMEAAALTVHPRGRQLLRRSVGALRELRVQR